MEETVTLKTHCDEELIVSTSMSPALSRELASSLDMILHRWLWLAILALLLLFKVLQCRKNLPTPPGPQISIFGLWKGIVMPNAFQWLTYAEWKKTYGEALFTFSLALLIFLARRHHFSQHSSKSHPCDQFGRGRPGSP